MTRHLTVLNLDIVITAGWVQSTKVLVMKPSPAFCCLFPLRLKYSLHDLVSKYHPATVLPLQGEGKFHTHKKQQAKNVGLSDKDKGLTWIRKVPSSNLSWNNEYPDLFFVAPQPPPSPSKLWQHLNLDDSFISHPFPFIIHTTTERYTECLIIIWHYFTGWFLDIKKSKRSSYEHVPWRSSLTITAINFHGHILNTSWA